MIRVKDPAVSLQFYTDVLGFQLVCHRDFPQWGFSVYFVAYCDPGDVPTDADEQFEFCMRFPHHTSLHTPHPAYIHPTCNLLFSRSSALPSASRELPDKLTADFLYRVAVNTTVVRTLDNSTATSHCSAHPSAAMYTTAAWSGRCT